MAKKAASSKTPAKAKEVENNMDDSKATIDEPTQADDGEGKENRKRKAEEKSDEEDEPNDNEEADEGEEDEKPTPVPPTTDIDLNKPIKRARTAYFIFSDEKRAEIQAKHKGEGVAAIARELGQVWSKMTAEEKAVYTEKAALEREEVSQQIAKLEAAGIDLSTLPGAAKANDATHADGLIFPLSRIRKIVKLDPEVKNLSKEALLLVTKCTELMTSKLGIECVRVAQIQNRRGLLAEDVANVVQTREQFLFLKDDVKDLVREQLAHQPPKTKKDQGVSKAATAAAANSKPLTAYFSAAKNS